MLLCVGWVSGLSVLVFVRFVWVSGLIFVRFVWVSGLSVLNVGCVDISDVVFLQFVLLVDRTWIVVVDIVWVVLVFEFLWHCIRGAVLYVDCS